MYMYVAKYAGHWNNSLNKVIIKHIDKYIPIYHIVAPGFSYDRI